MKQSGFFPSPLRAALWCAALLSGAGAAGAESNGLPLPLKGLDAAGTACYRLTHGIGAQPAAAVGAAAAAATADPRDFIVAKALAETLGKGDTVLVDTRSKSAYTLSHIDGALNVGVTELRTKNYLAKKTVVLLGDGKNDDDLLSQSAQLKLAGFRQTRVLRGGMLAWTQEQLAMTGRPPALADAASLSPAELYQQSQSTSSIIINTPAGRGLTDLLPRALDARDAGTRTIKDLAGAKGKAKTAHASVVLVADEQFDRSRIAELAEALKPTPFLVYLDGDAAYRKFMTTQKALWAKLDKGPTKPRCGS